MNSKICQPNLAKLHSSPWVQFFYTEPNSVIAQPSRIHFSLGASSNTGISRAQRPSLRPVILPYRQSKENKLKLGAKSSIPEIWSLEKSGWEPGLLLSQLNGNTLETKSTNSCRWSSQSYPGTYPPQTLIILLPFLQACSVSFLPMLSKTPSTVFINNKTMWTILPLAAKPILISLSLVTRMLTLLA